MLQEVALRYNTGRLLFIARNERPLGRSTQALVDDDHELRHRDEALRRASLSGLPAQGAFLAGPCPELVSAEQRVLAYETHLLLIGLSRTTSKL